MFETSNQGILLKSPQELLHIIKVSTSKQEKYILRNLSSDQWHILLSHLKDINIPSKDCKIEKLKCNKYILNSYIVMSNNDNVETIDNTDRQIINDTLSEIRMGRIGYIYHFRYIQTLLKYELNIRVELKDGIFYCWLDDKIKNKYRNELNELGLNYYIKHNS